MKRLQKTVAVVLVTASVTTSGAVAGGCQPSSNAHAPCTACAANASKASLPRGAKDAPGGGSEIELVESFPAETTLDHSDVRDAPDVWPEMIDRAKYTLDVAEFYASEAEGEAEKTSRLAPTIAAIGRATKRGVTVRFLADKVFATTYAKTLDQLRALGVTVKTIDCAPRYGGVQHAKYFVVDEDESFVGSQNFDWRALAHIQEIGVRVRSRSVAAALHEVFEIDWTLSDPKALSKVAARARPSTPDDTSRTGEAITFFASPKDWLPDESRWDLDRIVGLLNGARSSIDVQVLTYSTENRDKTSFTILDEALRRAAKRGVHVRFLVSHWALSPKGGAKRSIDALATESNVEVRVLTVPPWSGGEIPFARVSHAKYMVVDGRTAWVGTSNWEGDYFLKTRNVAIVTEGGALGPRLARVFDDGWSSTYTTVLQSAPKSP